MISVEKKPQCSKYRISDFSSFLRTTHFLHFHAAGTCTFFNMSLLYKEAVVIIVSDRPTCGPSVFHICKVNRLFFWIVRFLGELFSLPEKSKNCRFLRAQTEMENIPSPMLKIIYKILTLNLTRVYLTTLGFEGLSERGKTNFRKSLWDIFERKRIWSRFYSIF